jgi:hypothetical protein
VLCENLILGEFVICTPTKVTAEWECLTDMKALE